jgi:hypothetical protein
LPDFLDLCGISRDANTGRKNVIPRVGQEQREETSMQGPLPSLAAVLGADGSAARESRLSRTQIRMLATRDDRRRPGVLRSMVFGFMVPTLSNGSSD